MTAMTNTTEPVVVIGAGLTGMSASYHLRSMGIEHRIFERLNRAGGLAITVEDSGFRFDVTGHLLHLRNPQMRELVTELMGDRLMTLQRKSMVWSCGTYTNYPYQANTFGLPAEIAYECLMGFMETLKYTSNNGNTAHLDPPDNFEQYCYRHFGKGFSKHFMIPYNSRLWGVHPSEITSAWCNRFVPLPKLEDVIAGAVGMKPQQLGYNASFLYPETGIGELSNALATRLGNIEYGNSVTRVNSQRKCITLENGQTVAYRALVSSAPLDRLVQMIEDAPATVRQAASLLRCSSLWYLDVALDTACELPYHWVYVPEETYLFYRLGVYSNFSSEMAPSGTSCMYIELADRSEPNLDEIIPHVSQDLVKMGFISRRSQLLFARARHIEHAYVIYDHNYEKALSLVLSFLNKQHIISTGRYGGWNYSAMEDALLFGKDAAQQAARWML